MKKFIVSIILGIASLSAFAEATFDQIEGLIEQKNYAAAASGLEVIIQNHPKSAKAFYAMAQAQAGLGNLEKAQKALNIATGLNPTLDFAPQSSVQSLKEAITPQTKKIEAIEESHVYRNMLIGLLFIIVGGTVYVLYNRKKDEEEAERKAKEAQAEAERVEALRKQREQERQEEAAREILRQHPNYGNERFDPTNPDVLLPKKTKAQMKKEADEAARVEAEAEARRQRLRAEAAEDEARRARMVYSQPTPTTTVVNNGSSSGDFVTGMLVGNMLGGSHHHDHDTTIIREREVVRETPAPSRSSSWDDTPTPSISTRSSSWDDDSSSRSSSRSSSWDSDSSSSSSSSWSSSSSDSSSSWSSSDSGSSSSWD